MLSTLLADDGNERTLTQKLEEELCGGRNSEISELEWKMPR